MSVCTAAFALAQVTGTITNSDGTPIAGATVIVKGTNNGVASGVNGAYRINAQTSDVLVFSMIGMKTLEFPVNTRTVIDVVLESDDLSLDEIVVTGYGSIRKAAFTGSAQTISAEELTLKTDANVMKSLQGSVAGLQMFNINGQPGQYASVSIRGFGSVNSGTEPLYVIDGVPMYNSKDSGISGESNGADYASPISNINPEDIESMNVLKDATATAIYGARAANGVIVITTKRGATGAPKVSLTAKKGITTAASLDDDYCMVNTEEYLDIWTRGLLNAGWSDTYEGAGEWLNLYLGAWYGWEEGDTTDTDWLDEILRTGQVDEYNINVSGGTDKIKYYVSGGYFRNEGIVIATELERYSLRSNVDYDGKVVDFGLSSAVAHSMTLSVPTQSQYVNPIVAAYDLRPIEAVYNEDGSWNEDAYYNAVMVAEEDENYKRQITANINPYVTVDFGKGFSAKSNLGLDIYNLREFDYRSVYNPQGTDYNGLGQQYDYTNLNLMITNTINYNTKIDKHNISAMVGQEAQRIHSESSFFSASNYTYLQNTEIGGASTPSSAGSYTSQSHLASYFLNANYDYDDKYYLSGSLRYDGYSGFGMNNLWGTFYSIGGKWRVSQEAFFAPIQHVVNNLALRASYGTVGNSDIGWYASRGLYTSGYTYDSKPGALMSQIANDDLTWESRAKFNVGLDFRLFNRLNVEVDYYDERTKDMIFEMPVSHTVGTSYYMDNVGEMLNRGIEVLVNANIINTPNFSWDFNFNITKNHNEILKLDTDSPIEGTVTIRKVGEAYNTFYMAEYAGVDSETGAAMWYKGTEGTETTTDYTEAGQRIVGTADPKFYGGFGSSFKFRNFDASFQFNYKVGGKVYNSGFSYDMQVGHYYFGPVTNYVYENSWTPENTDTDVPIFVAGDDSNANATSSRFLMDASYLRLSNLSIGYTLPRSVSSRLKLDNVRIFATADNLFTVTASDYIGFDPECGSTGIQSWVYPTATTYMFGVQLGF